MVTSANPEAVYLIGERLRQCIHAKLVETPGGEPNRSCFITGAIAWDDCECGQLVVAAQQTFPSQNFPNPGEPVSGAAPCGAAGLAVTEYWVSMTRCSPDPAPNSDPPSCEVLGETARLTIWDAWAVQTAARCCLKEWASTNEEGTNARQIANYQVQQSQFVGAQGMCQGSQTSIYVGLINACLPCDDS